MKFGKVEIQIAPNLSGILVVTVLSLLDWRLGVAFVLVSVGAGVLAHFMKERWYLTEESEYAPFFKRTNEGCVPIVVFRGVKSHRRKKVVLELEGCSFANPDEAIAEASFLARTFNEKPLH